MKTYIALTIGPIYKTLSSARKTGELWTASYIFSYIMKEIVKDFSNKENNILLPSMSEELFSSNKEERYKGAGFFPDRFVFEKSEEDELDKLKNRVDRVLSELSTNIHQHLQNKKNEASKLVNKLNNEKKEFYQKKLTELNKIQDLAHVEAFIKEYFQIYFFEMQTDDPMDELYNYLDIAELQNKVIPKEEINYISLLSKNVNGSFLKIDAYGDKKGTFDSIPQIATRELHEELGDIFDDDIDDSDIYKHVEKDKKFKQYHKYIAIVQADGDNFGRHIKGLDDEKQREFSNKLLDFASTANETVKLYGGSVVYAGGDDLLFFAPIKNGDEHIFDLFNKLREEFSTKVSSEVSLSFGVCINYYKYPLYEALQDAQIELFEYAKTEEKNKTAIKLLQHSGQYIKTTLSHTSKSYDMFTALLKNSLEIDDDKDSLNSFHHTIRKFENVLESIKSDEEAIKNFFDNNFNDSHKEQYEEFIKIFVSYIVLIFKEETDTNLALKRLYTTLKLIKFFKGGDA